VKIPRFSARERRLLLFTVIVCGAALFYALVFRPLASKYQTLNRELELNTLALRQLQLLVQQKEQIETVYENYKDRLKTGKSDSEEIINILQEINSLTEGKKIIIQDMKPLRVENAEYHKKYYVRARIEGALVPLAALFFDIQNSPQVLKIESLFLDLRPSTLDFLADVVITRIVSKETAHAI
jgi:Tfp pilus assembly protein PilO